MISDGEGDSGGDGQQEENRNVGFGGGVLCGKILAHFPLYEKHFVMLWSPV
jgi:hypothetical protein